MKGRAILLWIAIAVLFLLHNDFWLWDDPRRLLGLPIGLTYHLAYCLAVAAVLAALLPRSLRDDGGEDGA